MRPWLIVLLSVLGVIIIALVALYFFGRKQEKKQDAQREQLKETAQTVSLLVIDKKHVKLKEAGFPAVVTDSTPKYLRGIKVPVVKAKIGPKVMSLMCDEKIFPLIPVKKEVKAVMSGIYITDVKGIRGQLTPDTRKTRKERREEKQKEKAKAKEKRTVK